MQEYRIVGFLHRVIGRFLLTGDLSAVPMELYLRIREHRFLHELLDDFKDLPWSELMLQVRPIWLAVPATCVCCLSTRHVVRKQACVLSCLCHEHTRDVNCDVRMVRLSKAWKIEHKRSCFLGVNRARCY